MKKMFFANTWLFGKVILKGMNAHTTTVATIIEGGMKDNVIPTTASVIVNFRIMPEETMEDVYDHIVKVIDDERIIVESFGGGSSSSPVASIDAVGYETLNKSLREVFGDIVVSPSLMPAATDSKHFVKVAKNSYRFNPARINGIEGAGFHGTNEHISIDAYRGAIQFYHQFIQNAGSSVE
ncbi:MAG: M20/M25/M40 family metallo-hydrolase [Cytophagales bacterium]|nr:M20/M25/M40 family metallo-hydrolase [Cytophagales bacterium]